MFCRQSVAEETGRWGRLAPFPHRSHNSAATISHRRNQQVPAAPLSTHQLLPRTRFSVVCSFSVEHKIFFKSDKVS